MHPVIAQRRRQEDRLAVANTAAAEYRRLGGIADFAHRSGNKVTAAIADKHATLLADRASDSLDDRRRKLALLLNTEQEELERAVEASLETPEQVMAKCVLGAFLGRF